MALTESQKRNAERNRIYWANREAEALKHRITDEREYDRQIKAIYGNMLDNIQKEIDGFYGRYASKEGITIAEAKKRASKADIEAYERKAKKYVKEKDFSPEANEEMRLYNLMMKVNRLEMLKANIGLETVAGHDELQKFMAGILKGRTEDELKRQAGILGKTVQDNAKLADAIVNASFHNATFSDRIWQYQDIMKDDLSKLLQTGLIQGKNPRAIAKDLRKYWYGNDPKTGGGAVYCMERLMRTELARVQTEAQKQSFERNGFEMYTFITNHGCCEICAALNGKHFKVKDMMPGENASPLHPNCRCSVAAYEDSDEYEAWLDYLDKGGTTAEWNRIKYIDDKYKSLSFMQKKEMVYKNEQTISRLQEQKKQEEFEFILANSPEEMKLAQEKVSKTKEQIRKLEQENKDILSRLGLPTNAKERFYHQTVKPDALPHDMQGNAETFAIGSWTRTDYIFINDYLRNGNKGVRAESIENAKVLRSMIERNVVQEPFTVKRGTDYNAMNHLFGSDNWKKDGYNVHGKIIKDNGFVATTPYNGGGFGGNIQMYIDVPIGAKGVYIGDASAAPDEKEFLLQCGSSFVVDKIEKTIDKWGEPNYDVYMKVISDERQ
jgi:SPP1 gp7 family putative phage head morphogenesis protein